MIDDATFYAWFRANSPRVFLVDMGFKVQEDIPGSPLDTTEPTDSFVHLSTQPYFGDAGSNQHYYDCISILPTFTRTVDQASLGGAVTISFGDMTLDNQDDRMSFLLDLACDGSVINFYIGDASWARSDFRLLFSALTQFVQAPQPDLLTVSLRDLGLLLNKSVGGTDLIGGTGPNAAQTKPYSFGYAHNVTCVLADTGPLLYVYASQGSVGVGGSPPEGVRDEGIGVSFTDNFDGTLNLVASPAGIVTADLYREVNDSVPGARVSQLIDELVTTLGGLIAPDNYLGAHPSFFVGGPDDYPVGLYITQLTNITDLLTQACQTALAFWSVTRDGRFTFGRLWPNDIPSLHIPVVAALTLDDIVTGTSGIVMTRLEPTYYAVPAIVNKNWTVQSAFAGALSADQIALYTRAGLTVDPSLVAPTTDDYADAPQLYHLTMVKSAAQETLISAIDDDKVMDPALRWYQQRVQQLLPWTEFIVLQVDLIYYYLEMGDCVSLDLGGKLGIGPGTLMQVAGVEMDIDPTTGAGTAEIKLTLVWRHLVDAIDASYDDLP